MQQINELIFFGDHEFFLNKKSLSPSHQHLFLKQINHSSVFQKLHLTLIVNRENRFITQHRIPITLAKMVSHHIRYVSLRFLKK